MPNMRFTRQDKLLLALGSAMIIGGCWGARAEGYQVVTQGAYSHRGFTSATTVRGLRDGFVDGDHYASAPPSYRKTVSIGGKRVKAIVTPCGAVHIDFLDGRSFKQPGCPEDR